MYVKTKEILFIIFYMTFKLEILDKMRYFKWSPHGVHGVYLESMWSLSGVCGVHIKYMESTWSTWSPHGLHIYSIQILMWSLNGVHMEFKWSPHGVHLESMWSPHGVYLEYVESKWSPHGVHGVHVLHLKCLILSEISNLKVI